MTEFYLLRHGQSTLGADDHDWLSDMGKQQCVWLGEHFAHKCLLFDRILTGRLGRHAQKLDAIRHALANGNMECEGCHGPDERDSRALFRALNNEHRALVERSKGGLRRFFKAFWQVLHRWAEGIIDARARETWGALQIRVAKVREATQRSGARRVLTLTSGA